MLKQIYVKAATGGQDLTRKMYDEASKYLENIGFAKTILLSVTDKESTFRSSMFTSGNEKVFIEYKKDMYEEVLKLMFSPLDIKFVHDILLMRFNQLNNEEEEKVYIYNE